MKDVWLVVVGNVPICIKEEDGQVYPITVFPHQHGIIIPLFNDLHTARSFAFRFKRRRYVFGGSVRIIKGRLYNGKD